MKKNRMMKIIAAVAALCMAAAMFAGCSKDKTNDGSDTSVSASDESSTDSSEEETVATQRPVAEGDIYAINKFKVKPPRKLRYGTEVAGGFRPAFPLYNR